MARPPDPALRMFWTRFIRDFDSQQESVAQYCRRANVSVPSFYQWKRRLSSVLSPSTGSAAFVPVNVKPPAAPAESSIQIELGSNCRIDLPQQCETLVLEIVRLALQSRSDAP